MNRHLGTKIFSLLFLFIATTAVAQSQELYFDKSGSGTYTISTNGLNASAQLKCQYTGRYPMRFSDYRFRDISYNFRAKTITAPINSRDSISVKLYSSTGRVQCFGPSRSQAGSGGNGNSGGSSSPEPVNDPEPSNPAPVTPAPAEQPTPAVPVVDETPVPAAPAAPEPEPEPEPEPVDDSHDHSDGDALNDVNDGSRGDYPIGEPGSSTLDVSRTGQLPSGSDGTGAFRTRCGYSHALKDDPIVYPGQPGRSHLHAFFGNTLADANSTVASIKDTGSSTCRGGIANRSSYWVPALLKLNGEMVVPEFMDVYYKSGYSLLPSTIKPFPPGLRMIAGDMNATGPQSNVYWGCGSYIGQKYGIPFGQCSSDDYYIATIAFPQCWDGVNLDSPDHKSHMAYPSGSSCPSSHPVAIPRITFHVHYPAKDFEGVKLSSDHNSDVRPGGSLHADWFEGWDEDIAETFVEKCVASALDCHSHLVGDGRTIH